MAGSYYRPCRELDECNRLIETYFQSGRYEECFRGHLVLAEQGYPLAECQIGYFYLEGLGTERDLEKSFYWTRRAAEHGDRDAQNNLADCFYWPGCVVAMDLAEAKKWYRRAAAQGHAEAGEKCRALGLDLASEVADAVPPPDGRD